MKVARIEQRPARSRRDLRLAAVGALALLGGCAHVETDPRTAEIAVPPQFHEAGTSGAAREDVVQWWSRFDDPQLSALIERAFAGNLDIASARARLRQARETEVQARAGRFPTIDAGGTVSQTTDTDGDTRTNLSLSGDAGYELDLFGGVTSSIRAAEATTDATRYDLASAYVSLASEVARAYVEARQAQEQLRTADQLLDYARDNLQIARWRNQAGLVSSLDVEQARGEVAQSEANLPTYRQNYDTAVHRLGVLLGLEPSALHSELEQAKAIPAAPSTIAVGIPLDTLRQRPDVMAAERNLDAGVARIGVARAELYPSLRLGGSIGGNGTGISQIVDGLVGTVFASISQLIFDGGRTRSQVRGQEATAEGALASYKQTVLLALEDVENALVALETARQRSRSIQEALSAAENQAILTRVSYRSGLIDFSELLNAERSLESANNGLIQSQANESLAAVQLYRALGGGWSEQIVQEGNAND